MKNKKALIAAVIAIVVLLAAAGTSVVAYMFRRTDTALNSFTPASVSCRVSEATDSPLTKKTEIKIQNTGTIDAYLRLRIVSFWVDADGNILSKSSVIPSVSLAGGWVRGSGDTYYYSTPIAPGSSTPNLLSSPLELAQDGDALQTVQIIAEAIQSKPGNAVTESWHVTLDANGKITAAG